MSSIMELLVAGNPSQPATTTIGEFHETGEMHIDLQSGTTVHQFLINGDPGEAELSAASLTYGVPHPWTSKTDYFLTNVHLKPHVKQDTTDERRTLVTLTFRKRPCPGMYEEEAIGTLMSHQTWWSRSNDQGSPPRQLNGVVGLSVLQPSVLLKRRYPRVTDKSHAQIDTGVDKHLGTRNTIALATATGVGIGEWLFREARRKLLYGNPATGAAWEFSLVFLRDPYRSHAYWAAKVEKGKLVPPVWANDHWDYAGAHFVSHLYPLVSPDGTDFNSLVDAGGNCDPAAIPAA